MPALRVDDVELVDVHGWSSESSVRAGTGTGSSSPAMRTLLAYGTAVGAPEYTLGGRPVGVAGCDELPEDDDDESIDVFRRRELGS